MDKKITKIIFRQDTSTNMDNVTLDLGEPAIALVNGNTGVFKIGDGVTKFSDLPTISATHIIEEPTADGEYLRKKEGNAYSWVSKDLRKTLTDLLEQPYNVEVDMGYDTLDVSGNSRRVYGIRKSYIVSVNANVINTQTIAEEIYSIIDSNGYVVAGNEGKVSINTSNDKCKCSLFITPDNKLTLETIATCDRLDNLIDVWVLYTKVQ